MKLKLLLLALLALSTISFATTQIYAPAVDSNGKGILTPITATATQGSGKIRTDIQGSLIATETEESIRAAALVASEILEIDLNEVDINVDIESDAQLIDGPSGGLAFGIIIFNELIHVVNPNYANIRGDMVVTGAITLEGRIEKVGGVEEKILAARENGVKLMLIASGQSISDAFDYSIYAREISEGELQVVEVQNLQEALEYAYTIEGSKVETNERIIQPLALEKFSASEKTLHVKSIALEEIEKARRELQQLTTEVNSNAERDQQAIAVIRSVNETLKNAQQAVDNNYYYTGANAAFLANINLKTINAEGLTSEEFQQMINELESEFNSFNRTKTIGKNNYEEIAAGQLRYWWARVKLQEVKETFTNTNSISIGVVRDYYNAVSWFEASKKLLRHASGLSPGEGLNEYNLREYALDLIEEGEAIANTSTDSEVEWHLKTAEAAFSNADYLAATFDLQFVISAKTTNALITGKTPEQILEEFGKVDIKNIYDNGRENSHWAELYYASAIYSLQDANRTGDLSLVITSVRLKQLASGFQGAARQVLSEVDNPRPLSNRTIEPLNTLPQISQEPTVIAEITSSNTMPGTLQLIAALVILIGAVILIGILLSKIKHGKPLSKEQLSEKLDEALITGRISEETYKRLSAKYHKEEKTNRPRVKLKKKRK